MTVRQLEAALVGSAEFGTKYGGTTNAEFVDLLYRNVLDRSADPGGLSFWVGGLDAAQSPGRTWCTASPSRTS